MGAQLTTLNIEDLSGAVATSGNVTTIGAEANAAHNALVGQSVDQVDIQYTADTGIEDGEPILTLPLEPLVNVLRIELRQGVSNVRCRGGEGIRGFVELPGGRSGARDLGRSGVGRSGVLLRGRRSRRTTGRPRLARTRRGCGLRRALRTVAYDTVRSKVLEKGA